MTQRLAGWFVVSLSVALGWPENGRAEDKAKPVSFEEEVRPILKAYCFECHGEEPKLKGGLDVRLSRLIHQGGDSGPAVVAGQPQESLLIQRVQDDEMPPGKKKLTAEEKAVLARWVAEGARADRPEPEHLAIGFQISESDRQYWAFQPIRPPQPPPLASHPIDAFLLARLREQGLSFAPEADRATLIRRAWWDLLGLPPPPEEVEAFVKDPSPNAWEQLIDKLLASPHYGERWARHWLDVAGYADSEGYDAKDTVRTNAWKYRDYVIRSFNADKPFDRFIQEQIAGDELVGAPVKEFTPEVVDALTATGFLRMAPDGTGTAPANEQTTARNAVIAETLKIISSAFLGLTVGCAQCHHHRHDPISQEDYYRLRAIFEPAFDLTAWKVPSARQISLATAADRKKAQELEAQAEKIDAERVKLTNEALAKALEQALAKVPEAQREAARKAAQTPAARQTPQQKKLLAAHPGLSINAGDLRAINRPVYDQIQAMLEQAAKIRAQKPTLDTVRGVSETPGKVPDTFLFHRGDPDQRRETIAPGVLSVLADRLPYPTPKPTAAGSGRRLAFARWLTDPNNPLTARVIVNRVWHHHFGQGIVRTPGDFGRFGEKPTHPELLDWLAQDFITHQWSLKHLHRRILTSQAYRQSSRRGADADKDPDNRLLGRFPLRRLDAEALRDGILAVAGSLNPKAFGPPVPVRENEVGQVVLGIDNRDSAGRFTKPIPLPPGEDLRRSVYVQVRRTWPLAVLETFDWANPEPNCEARASSTSTPQSLMLLNGDFVQEQSERMAKRVLSEAGSEPARRVARAWSLVYGTVPNRAQAASGLAFLEEMTRLFAEQESPAGKAKEATPPPELRALAAFCQTLLCSNRFLYVD